MPSSTPVSSGEFWVDSLVSELYYPGPQSVGSDPHVRDMERIVTQSGTRGLVGATSGVMVTNNSGVWQQLPQDPDGDGIQEFAQAIGVSKRGHVLCDSHHVWIDGEYLLIWNLIAGSNYVFCKKMASNGVIAAERFSGAPVLLLPVEVVELAPQVLDESANPIVGSEKPNQTLPLTPFVEILPHTNKIAHRELKVKIGEALAGKTVTWTMEPLFVPNYNPNGPNLPPVFRGEWSHSSTHPNRFESSTTYGANGWVGISQASSRTTVSNDGFTAVRVNVPPIGFNQARIRMQIEGVTALVDLIDMEVPAVVVIDPGHGGTDSGAQGGTGNNTVNEKDLALAYGLSIRDELIDKFTDEKHGLRFKLTRKDDDFIELLDRAPIAKDAGADVFVSIHFNSGASSARGTETLVRGANNTNEADDTVLAGLFLASTFAAVQSEDAAAINRGVKNYAWSQSQGKNVPSQWAVLSDTGYGNTTAYSPVRGAIIEVEFVSNATALESVRLSTAAGMEIKTKVATSVATDIFNNIRDEP
ncbi:MAG: N-acetylmuramoyl-L-alanine amidase [Verrucomicrobiales bacterium]